MGFYDEDGTFGEVPEDKHSQFSQPEAKRIRLNETITWMGERGKSASEDALCNAGEVNDDDDGDDDDSEERDPEETAARHEVLRRIGLKTKPTNALRRYMKKVASGSELNPWLSTVHTEKDLRKKLRRVVLAMLVKACKDEGVEDSKLDRSHEEAIKFVDRLNEELVESLSILGHFSSDLIRCARNNCQKAFLPNHVAHTLLSRVQGDYTHCQVPECPHTVQTHDDVNYLIVEGGCYSQRLEMPNSTESPSKVKEVLKVRKFKDSDEVIEELPSDVIRSLVHFYMARYFCLWVFGDEEMWSKNGFTLFQVLFGMDSQVA